MEGLASFALLAPGYGGPGWTLLRDLAPVSPRGRGARLVFAGFEDPAGRARVFAARREETVRPALGPDPGPLRPRLDARGHAAKVRRIRAAIARGDVYQVCLCASARLGPATGAEILRRFCRRGAPRFAAWARLPGGPEFVSASPELFFTVDGDRARVEPMKGTAAPGALAELRRSAKDRAELAMITDLLRNDLTPVCRPRTVRVAAARRFLRLPYAVQAVSDVRGRLKPGAGPLEVLAALHPGGSVVGAPKRAALTMIRALEPRPRGAYCGALGLARGPRAAFSLLIRTAQRGASGWVYGVGGGVVWGSRPVAERRELDVKLGAL